MWGYLIEHYQKKKCLVDGEHWPETETQGFRYEMRLVWYFLQFHVEDQDLRSPIFQRNKHQ